MQSNHEPGAMSRLARRVMLAIGRGRVTFTNDSGVVQLMQVRLGAEELRDGTPRLAEFGLSSNPPAGSDAMVLFIGGDRSNAIVIATGNQQSRPQGLKPGETIIYDAFGKSVWLTQDNGIVVEANGANVTLNNAPTTTLNTNLQVNGTINATGDIAGSGHSLSGHHHNAQGATAATSSTIG